MDSVDWSRCMADIYFAHGDPQGELRKFRHMIPQFVLRTFCNSNDQTGYIIYDQNQMPTWVGDSETLTIYKPETKESEKRHWTECFGADNIYSSYFDNLTTNIWMREGFRKFEVLKKVDREIFNGLVDPIWQISQQQSAGIIQLRREDVNTLRKFLFLHTSLQNRDRTMHLMAHASQMEDARMRRKVHIETYGMEHPRDVWLQNAEKIINTSHHEVANNEEIFDLDREDYRANARERYLVFWEAQPGDEFIITDNAFGGFEGGQIGDKKNSQVNMSARELEQHIYTRDFMWHQLYVISPTLVVALCHGTLMNPELTRLQRKRWGLRRSLLESLPHQPAPRYYKDMAKNEATFLKPGWVLPSDVEKAFGGVDAKSIAPDRRMEEDLMFPVMPLDSNQVAMVNSVLLHHQQHGKKVKSVCYKSPPSYNSLYLSLNQFQRTPWNKYSAEKQNDYSPLTERVVSFLNPTPPPEPIGPLYVQPLQSGYSIHAHQMPISGLPKMTDPRPGFGDRRRSITPSDIPNFVPGQFEMNLSAHSRPHSQTTQSAHSLMSHNSLASSSLTPSSQSSQYSSASSQSSVSTKTTSIDTPRFEPKQPSNDHHNRSNRQSPTRKPDPQHHVNQTYPEPPRSDESGKPRKVDNKSEKPNSQKPNDIAIENIPQGVEVRGRQPDLVKPQQPAPRKTSNPRSEYARQAEMLPPPQPAAPVQRSNAMPERPTYVMEADRSRPSERSQFQPQQTRVQRASSIPKRQSVVIDNAPPRQLEPEKTEQPPKIVHERQSSPQSQPQSGSHDTARGRTYEIVQAGQRQRSANTSSGTERSSQSEDSLRGRQYETVRVEPPEARRTSISVERSSHGSDKARRQQYSVTSDLPSSQYNSTSSGERPLRDGVEIIRARQSEAPKIEQPRPQNPTTTQPTSTYLEVVENATKVSELPVIKRLRFDTRTLTHKHSDSSLAGSMVVETGDVVEDGDDEGSWEDEGFAEAEELKKPQKPTVRFAGWTLPKTGGRGIHIERPSSRLGRKAESQPAMAKLGRRTVQIEPRNGQRYEASRKPGVTTAATNRNRNLLQPHAQPHVQHRAN